MAYRGPKPKFEELTVSKAETGGDVPVTVSNTDTSASSTATHTVSVNGGSAGDPTYVATVSGVQSWSCGIDNSDSDKFILGTGTTLGSGNGLEIDTSGNIAVTGSLTADSLAILDSGNTGTIRS